MAKNITIAGVSFNAVPSIDVPVTGGGTARFSDTSDATATADKILSGYTAYGATGEKLTGTASGGGGGEIEVLPLMSLMSQFPDASLDVVRETFTEIRAPGVNSFGMFRLLSGETGYIEETYHMGYDGALLPSNADIVGVILDLYAFTPSFNSGLAMEYDVTLYDGKSQPSTVHISESTVPADNHYRMKLENAALQISDLMNITITVRAFNTLTGGGIITIEPIYYDRSVLTILYRTQ